MSLPVTQLEYNTISSVITQRVKFWSEIQKEFDPLEFRIEPFIRLSNFVISDLETIKIKISKYIRKFSGVTFMFPQIFGFTSILCLHRIYDLILRYFTREETKNWRNNKITRYADFYDIAIISEQIAINEAKLNKDFPIYLKKYLEKLQTLLDRAI